MLVPGHVVSMYVATCGASGQLLGSDEKEIILLVYAVIDASTNKVVGVQQYLVRPTGGFGSSDGTVANSDTIINGISTAIVANNNSLAPIEAATTTSTTIATTVTSAIAAAAATTTTTTTSPSVPITSNNNVHNELAITDALLEVAGRPLNEIIDKFDRYVRSLNIDPDSPNFRLVTDGSLPLRQCLHPEACAKDIELPSYYCRYSDLRKEFVRYKSADLSRALIAVKDVKKLPNMPSVPTVPLSIADMMKELDLTSYYEADSDFYAKESRDMITLVQTMIAAGHKFEANEIINLTLEPGICSIDDEIDGLCIVRARGLPWQSSDLDIAKFFRGLNVAKGGVALCLSAQGRRNGEALVRFVSQEHRDMALKRHKHHIGSRYIEVYRASGDDFLSVAGGASNEAQAFLSKGAQVIIRMRGLPYDCTAKQVLDFFANGDDPCQVMDGAESILFVKKPDGRATGDAFVLFTSESDAPKALSRHRESIGQRYIELFRSTTAEVQQVLNRSMDPKTYEPAHPLIAQIPPVQMPLLPQHVITSGTAKNCIRLRGLPYEARVEHILHFLEDFAKNIIYQGVHMVYNAQGQPSGEAFIQMDSEDAARASAQLKHNRFMAFGKKFRYIEVFQCSGDDMNLVLNGGLHSPANPTKPPLLSPGGTMVGPAFGGYAPFAPTVLSPRGHPAFYPQPYIYWSYPSPPVSPTGYYGPPQPPPHVPQNLGPQRQPALLIDYITSQHHPQQQPPPSLSPIISHHHTAMQPHNGVVQSSAVLSPESPAKQFYASAAATTSPQHHAVAALPPIEADLPPNILSHHEKLVQQQQQSPPQHSQPQPPQRIYRTVPAAVLPNPFVELFIV